MIDLQSGFMTEPGQTADLKNLYVVFYVEGEICALDIAEVREINSEFQITPIPHAPYPVEGYVNLRGRIHLIINIDRYFRVMDNPEHDWSGEKIDFLQQSTWMDLSGLSIPGKRDPVIEGKENLRNSLHYESGPRLILFKENVSAPSGILVNEIGDILSVPPSRIEEFSSGKGEGKRASRGGASEIFQKVLKRDEDLILSISAAKLMKSIEGLT